MSNRTTAPLEAFEALPVEEKQSFAIEILKRTRELPLDSGPVEDEEIGEGARRSSDFSIAKRMHPPRGEVWLFDLGMAAKIRPVVIVSVPYGDVDRALVTVVPHTTALRGSPFEVPVPTPFLRPGAFLVQGISTYPRAWAIRRIGALKKDHLAADEAGVRSWLGFSENQPSS